MSIETEVELETGWGTSHNQGLRPTCLSFALSDLNALGHKLNVALSAEFLYRSAANLMGNWTPGMGLALSAACAALASPGQPDALACPYLGDEPVELPPTIPTIAGQAYVNTPSHVGTDQASVLHVLRSGVPVGLIVRLTRTFYEPVAGAIEYSDHVLKDAMCHALIATGIGRNLETGDTFVRIRNSWGAGWGDEGNAWLPLKYVEVHAVVAFKV
jgi:hypothetical protein